MGTRWRSKDIWIGREVILNEDLTGNDLRAKFSHDEMLELYINGILIVKTGTVGKSGEKGGLKSNRSINYCPN